MSGTLGIPENVAYATAAIYAVLILASLIVVFLRFRNPGERYQELADRTESWWWMIGAFTACVLFNQTVAVIFVAFISYLALKEYLSLIPTLRIDRAILLFAYLAIPIQFYWAATDWYGMFIVFVPVWMFLFFPALMAALGETQGFLRAVGTLSWGLMMTVFTLSHMAWLLVSGDRVNPVAGGLGLLFFLVVLTQFNDAAQYCWGKLFGRHKVTPTVSPKKTREGLIGGVATTTALAAAADPISRRWIGAGRYLQARSWGSRDSLATLRYRRSSAISASRIRAASSPAMAAFSIGSIVSLTQRPLSCISSATSSIHEPEPFHEAAQVPGFRGRGASGHPRRARAHRAPS